MLSEIEKFCEKSSRMIVAVIERKKVEKAEIER